MVAKPFAPGRSATNVAAQRDGMAHEAAPTRSRSAGEDDKNSSVVRKLEVRVFIAQCLFIQGCGSGPRSARQRWRGPLSDCRSTASADTTTLPRHPTCSKGPRNTPGTLNAVMVNVRRGGSLCLSSAAYSAFDPGAHADRSALTIVVVFGCRGLKLRQTL